MRKSHAAGWASDAPTPAQLSEFFAQIKKGKVTKDRFQAFLRGEPVVEGLLTEAEQLAVEILGPGKVLGYRDVCRVQKAELPVIEPVIPFADGVLRECAEANAQGIANWRLAYVVGRSLRQEREVVGWNRKKQPCFDPDWAWWLGWSHDYWATVPVDPGYRLFDFTNRFASMLWGDQESSVTQLGTDFERAEEQAVAEICFSNFLLSPNKERLLCNWYHWGKFRSVDGPRVCVGHLAQVGFHVSDDWDGRPYACLGVVVARKSRGSSP